MYYKLLYLQRRARLQADARQDRRPDVGQILTIDYLLFVLLEARLAYNLTGYGVTLLSGSIAASSGMARRAIASTLRKS